MASQPSLEIPVRVRELGAIPTLEEVERAARSWFPRLWFYAAIIRVAGRPRCAIAVLGAQWRRRRGLIEIPIGLKFAD